MGIKKIKAFKDTLLQTPSYRLSSTTPVITWIEHIEHKAEVSGL